MILFGTQNNNIEDKKKKKTTEGFTYTYETEPIKTNLAAVTFHFFQFDSSRKDSNFTFLEIGANVLRKVILFNYFFSFLWRITTTMGTQSHVITVMGPKWLDFYHSVNVISYGQDKVITLFQLYSRETVGCSTFFISINVLFDSDYVRQ